MQYEKAGASLLVGGPNRKTLLPYPWFTDHLSKAEQKVDHKADHKVDQNVG
jgi:hypothetical protein